MATVVTAIDAVTEWVQSSICNKVLLKKPPADGSAPNDRNYVYETVRPHAFALFVPPQDKIPNSKSLQGVAPIPSVCVRVSGGECDFAANENTIMFELCISTWDTGLHGRDVYKPAGVNTYERWDDRESESYFEKNGDGWRDAWNIIDVALREIGRAGSIGGMQLDRSVPVRFSPLKEQDSIPDFYPYWFTVLTFGLTQPIWPNNAPLIPDDIKNFL